MKQNLILFSALLLIFLIGTASAIENAENTDLVSVDTGLSVSISYNESGPFKMGDVVEITATFSDPVIYAQAKVENSVLTPVNMTNMTFVGDTVWTYDYLVPAGINDAVDVTIYGFPIGDVVEETDTAAFVVDNEKPIFKSVKPNSNPVYTDCVLFEFSAFDRLDNEVDYTVSLNGTEKKSGTITSSDTVEFEPEIADGYYPLEITLEDDAGNTATWGPINLYVDSKDPSVTLVSPANLSVFSTKNPTVAFNFTAQDTVSANYNLEMDYQVYIDGEPTFINGTMLSGQYINRSYGMLSDGVHNWSVSVEDMAGNNCSGKSRNFYVDLKGLQVSPISPDGGYVSANPEFNFSVMGGAGLPFDYELLINGTEVKNGSFVVGEDLINYYSVNATVEDAENIPWTVRITDIAGNVYTPNPLYFSVDTVAPAAVSNLNVTDALSNTTWESVYDEPGLLVLWDKNTESDLADTPYEIYISDFKPSSLDEMEEAVPVSMIYDADPYMYMYIGTYGGEPLVYGKDYWVAVIALDRAGNYDDDFALCGPAQTYEDMSFMLDAGWNLKSVPKTPAAFNDDPESVFGECTTVIYWNGSCWDYPKTIEPCKGYWVYTPEACESNVKFKPMSLDSSTPDVPPSLDLAPGWQMIGHTSLLPVTWDETLGSLQGLLGLEYKFSNIITYSHDEGWGGTISLGVTDIALLKQSVGAYPVGILQTENYMVPGQGYWIFMKEEGTYASVENVDFYGVV